MPSSNVLIVHEPTMGMHHDAAVLEAALKDSNPDISVYSLDIPWNPNLDYESEVCVPPEITALAPFRAAFFFEHLYGHPPLRSSEFARKRIFIPNIEWILPPDEAEILIRPPDAILYKNTFSREMCSGIRGFPEVSVSHVTGWTSSDFTIGTSAEHAKDYQSFLHVKGLSDQKQTSLILKVWLDNPDFPKLMILANLHDSFEVPTTLKASHNIEMVFRKLPTPELRRYQQSCGVHIYPSYAEGFGHSLNEARVCGSILITTDGPPMRDLVRHRKTGFLVPVEHTNIKPLRRSISYEVCADALAQTIREVLETPVDDLRDIGKLARKAYLWDRQSFHTRIAEIFGRAGVIPL